MQKGSFISASSKPMLLIILVSGFILPRISTLSRPHHLMVPHFNPFPGEQSYQQSINLALQGRAEEATRILYNFLVNARGDSTVRRAYRDIYDILSVRERREYRQAKDKARWLLRFWRHNDPTPATLVNERYVEHCKRLAYARKHFRSPQPRGYDDRGVIYLRYGPPDDKYVSNLGESTRDNESWVYHRFKDVSFDFVEFGGVFWIVNDLRRAIVPVNNKLVILTHLFEERSQLSLAYQITAWQLQQKLLGLNHNSVESILQYEYLQRVDKVKVSLPTRTSDFAPEEKSLPFWAMTAAFATGYFPDRMRRASLSTPGSGPNRKLTRLELYYAIPLHKIFAQKLFNQKGPALLDLNFAIFDKKDDLVLQHHDSLQLDLASVLAQNDYLGQLTFFLEPDTYRVALDFLSRKTHQRGLMQIQMDVQDFSGGKLGMSDIELASEVRPARQTDREKGFIKHGLYVHPYPYNAIPREQPISLYYEVYNLQPDTSGTTRYTVTYEVEQRGGKGVLAMLSALNPFGGKKSSLSLLYHFTSKDRHRADYTSLDFSRLKPGKHVLVVKVKDEVSGQEVSRRLKFNIMP
ncbi:MAG: GWxTD domain-containing protein [Calditrichaeota bacterium]|nr:MAG: GWxTD domain-containing protein [Calditrichota bacterium]